MAKAIYPKKRYVLFKVIGPQRSEVSEDALWQFFFSKSADFLGIVGLSRARLRKISFEPATHKGIFRVTNALHQRMCACIPLFGRIEISQEGTHSKPVQARICITKTSGSILSLKEQGAAKSKSAPKE